MSLQFILGNSGSGKTEYAFREIVREAQNNRDKNYLIIVPEQFTMQTQKTLVELAPNKAIMNIDVLSFKRLAYRVFDDMGKNDIKVLEETGKNLVLRRVAKEKEEELTVLRANMGRMGYIQELKSLISELVQYNIGPDQLLTYAKGSSVPPTFREKLKDIVTMYQGFQDYMKDSYITEEEILNVLIGCVAESSLLKDSVVVFDEFTGFTPIQNRLLYQLLSYTDKLLVLLTMDEKEDYSHCKGEHELFYLSKKTIKTLSDMASELKVEILKPVVLGDSDKKRFKNASGLGFMEKNLFRPWYQKSKEEVEEISLTALKNPKDELLFAARQINGLVMSGAYRYRDIALVTGAVESYSNYVEEIFTKYKIPYFMDQTTEVLFHPFIEAIRAMLEIVESDFSYEAVMRFLRTGFSDLEEKQIDMLENYLLAVNIRGASAWKKRWLKEPRNSSMCDLLEMEELRKGIWDKFAALYGIFHEKGSVHDELVCLYETIVAFNMENKLALREATLLQEGKQAKAKEYEQIYRIIMELLEKYEGLLGQENMEIQEFIEILEAGLSAASVAAIPPGFDSVTIGDIERTRLQGVKVLFFVGVNDGIIPKSLNHGGIISEYEREMMEEARIELAPGAREQAFIQRFYLYRNLTKPSERLYVSYAKVDANGGALRPSYLVQSLRSIFPKLAPTEYDEMRQLMDTSTEKAARDYFVYGDHDENWFALANYFSREDREDFELMKAIIEAPFSSYHKDPISRAVTQAIYGHTTEGSVTRLEQFASCAYGHFLRYGLKLRERDEGKFENLDIGNLYHNALKKYANDLAESAYDWFTVPEEERLALSDKALKEAILEYNQLSFFESAKGRYQIEKMDGIFKETVWALTKQVRAGRFVPSEFEVSFYEMGDLNALSYTLSENEVMKLKGRIDRVDELDEEGKLAVKIIDYKSGNTAFNLVRVYQGLSLQLVVYMNAAMEYLKAKNPGKEVLPGGILYYHIDDPVLPFHEGNEVSEAELKEELLMALRPDGLVNGDEAIYRAMDENFEKKSAVIPVELKANGEPGAYAKVASTESFQVMEEYVGNQIRKQAERIYGGDVEINPYEEGMTSSCSHCPYGGVCGFDRRTPGFKYRKLEKMSKDEALAKMEIENAMERGQK